MSSEPSAQAEQKDTFVALLEILLIRAYEPTKPSEFYHKQAEQLLTLTTAPETFEDPRIEFAKLGRLVIFGLCVDHPRELYQSYLSELDCAYSADAAVRAAYENRRDEFNRYCASAQKLQQIAERQFFVEYQATQELTEQLVHAEADAKSVHQKLTESEQQIAKVETEKQKRKQIENAEKETQILMQDLIFLLDRQNRSGKQSEPTFS
jgi:hypothetical protein